MKEFVEGREPLDKMFPTMWQKHGAAMLRADLEAAGIQYKDVNGRRRDFHSLRHTFGTLLGKADVTLVYVQKCMRHSDPKLTVRYTDVGLDDKAKSIARLPEIKDRPQSRENGCASDR